jgi:hypothetical protein
MSFIVTGGALLLGTGLSIYNNDKAANEQDAALAAGQRQQGQLQQQANQATQKLINQYQTSSQGPYQAKSLQQFMAAMNANPGNNAQPLNQVGATSSAYQAGAKQAAQGISTYGNTTAGLMSQMDAPAMQRQALTGDTLAYGSNLGEIQNQSKTDQFLAQLKAQSDQPNPWLSGVSSLLGAFGGAYGKGAFGGGSAAGVSDGTTGSTPYSWGDGTSSNLPVYG